MSDTTTTTESTTEAPATAVPATPIPMKRDFRKGGKGVTRAMVNPEQVADFEAAGWVRA